MVRAPLVIGGGGGGMLMQQKQKEKKKKSRGVRNCGSLIFIDVKQVCPMESILFAAIPVAVSTNARACGSQFDTGPDPQGWKLN